METWTENHPILLIAAMLSLIILVSITALTTKKIGHLPLKCFPGFFWCKTGFISEKQYVAACAAICKWRSLANGTWVIAGASDHCPSS